MVHVTPIVDEGLGNAAWLVDLGDGSALVVDPERDPRPYLAEADRQGLSFRLVVETHLHADFVSGGRELVDTAGGGVGLLAPAAARLAYHHDPVIDGEEVAAGGLTLRVLATPGHTPEHVSYLLVEGERPLALFSGGTLIVGGVARPDLIAPHLDEPLARAAWRSITTRLLTLPDELPVYPTHGGGSFCSAGSAERRSTTIGDERRENALLQAASEDAFVEGLLGGLGSYPPYFLRLREVNRRGPRRYGLVTPALSPLGIGAVDRLRAQGAELIDVRRVAEFAAGHIPGALSIELRDRFATWLGWVVDDPATPLVFVVDVEQDRDQLVRQCLNVGYEQLAGELAGGVDAWRAAGRQVTTTELLDEPRPASAVLDVRQTSEWEEGHVRGALHVELGSLARRAAEVPAGPVVAHCAHGQRSMTAASVLERAGRRDVAVFTGGPGEWTDPSGQRVAAGR
ncbi:MAG TPA: MBL fold metallo-hydrolase [Nitriliruptorales bacterium]|nr:MBL fold metallo-hydrolase [Nitriliruptorales bacterium]